MTLDITGSQCQRIHLSQSEIVFLCQPAAAAVVEMTVTHILLLSFIKRLVGGTLSCVDYYVSQPHSFLPSFPDTQSVFYVTLDRVISGTSTVYTVKT